MVLSGIALTLAVVGSGSAGAELLSDELRAFRPEADTYVRTRPGSEHRRARSLRAAGARGKRLHPLPDRRAQGLDHQRDAAAAHRPRRARARQVRRVYEDKWRERGLTFENAPRLSLRYVSSKPVRRGIWAPST